MTEKEIKKHFKESASLRAAFWKRIGKPDAHVLVPAINPALMGGPMWPSMRQAFITVRAPSATILASDGLSDPFDDPDDTPPGDPTNGFGLEFYAELAGPGEKTRGHWAFDLVNQISQTGAYEGNLRSVLKELGSMTMELYDVGVPKEFRNAAGRAGIFIGLPSSIVPAQATLSLETIDMINIKLLTRRELEYAAESGDEGRATLKKLLMAQGNPTVSDLKRESVI